MTLSICVVTNERRYGTHAAQVRELATEMKVCAKSLPGSVFTVDRHSEAGDAHAYAHAYAHVGLVTRTERT
jgi:hypothetical protein